MTSCGWGDKSELRIKQTGKRRGNSEGQIDRERKEVETEKMSREKMMGDGKVEIKTLPEGEEGLN